MQESLIFRNTLWTKQSHLEIQTDASECSGNGSVTTTAVLPETVSYKRNLSSLSLACPALFFSKCSTEWEEWNIILSIKPLLLSGGWQSRWPVQKSLPNSERC